MTDLNHNELVENTGSRRSGHISRSKVTLEEREAKHQEIQEIISKCRSILQITSVYFKESDSQAKQVKPTVRCVHNIKIKDLIRSVILNQWKLSNPRIVVLIMSNVGSVKNWTNDKQIKSFQKGLMKAAESTNMWLITNGIDIGSTTIIGDAVSDYQTDTKYKRQTNRDKKTSKFNFIGIADQEMVKYLPTIAQNDEELKIEIQSEGMAYDQNKQELNHNLSHYILIKDESIDKNGINTFLSNLIRFLTFNQKEVAEKAIHPMATQSADDLLSIETNEVPVVSLLIKGGYGCSRLVLDQIQQQIPVVVLRGTGGLADLLAFVDNEIRDRCLNLWDPEFVETHLKPELTLRIIGIFPKYRTNTLLLNRFRHRILEAVRLSRKDGQEYFTVINMFDTYSCDLENLTEYMLSALFKTQQKVSTEVISKIESQPSKTSPDLIKRDLTLCVDWNCPDVAKKEVLTKDTTFSLNDEKRLFEESLIRKNRCAFVDLFLSQKFKLRTFLSPKRLKRMFRKIHSHEFFSTICLETILGRPHGTKQSQHFIDNELNWLVEACTGIKDFFDEEELNFFITGQFPYSEKEAERKAHEILVLWAILDYRKRLVRILWRHSDRPIHLALIIAMSYERLSWYVSEESLKEDMKTESKQFVSFSLTVLDKCYKESALRSENVLNESSQDWKYKTAVDLAAFGRFRLFFAHPSVQRWLTHRFYGDIIVKDLRIKWIRVPTLVKLLLSAYLVVPSYLWIRSANIPLIVDEEEDVEEDEDDDKQKASAVEKIATEITDSEKGSENTSSAETTPEKKVERKKSKPNLKKAPELSEKAIDKKIFTRQPIWTLVYDVWSAPITKFWNFQFFYTFYLSVFCIAVLYPRCGNYYLDLLIAIWTSLLIVDDCRQTYIFSHNNSNVSIVFRLIEIIFRTIFLMLYTTSRLIVEPEDALRPYQDKVIMCLALLHAFYVLFAVFLPISPTLGPLLFRLKIMILVDFLNFIRLSILVMISFGVVIQAILYPDLTINNELFRQTLHRAFFSLFLTPADELLVDIRCEQSYRRFRNTTESTNLCSASVYTEPQCRVTGAWPYIFMVSYFVLLKLILMTLLFALFASSATALTADTDVIWKFQRYALVQDFVTRAPLPPPLNLFYYIFSIFRWFSTFCRSKPFQRNKFKLKDFFSLFKSYSRNRSYTRLLADDEYTYFKLLASQTYEEYQNKSNLETIASQQWDRIQYLSDEIQYQNQTIRQLKGKISGMDRTNRNAYVILETLKHMNRKTGFEIIGRKGLHILSRHSPYPNTTVQRFPVPDKYVSWDVMFVDYDPIAYTKQKSDFPKALQDYTDEDILLLSEYGFEKDRHDLPVLEWNRMSTNAAGISIDRQSWEEVESERIIYKLDNNLPVNPFGRTGLRGRGSLLRWGPNHYVMVVITRDNGNDLEVLAEKVDQKSNIISLITRFIPAEITFKSIESLFKIEIGELKHWVDSQKMIDYFKTFDETTNTQNVDPNAEPIVTSNLKFERLMKGYFDDAFNTDQAWKEVELWHFHFSKADALNEAYVDSLGWYSVTESFFSALSLSQTYIIELIVDKLKAQIIR